MMKIRLVSDRRHPRYLRLDAAGHESLSSSSPGLIKIDIGF